jgi:hypothetical protein
MGAKWNTRTYRALVGEQKERDHQENLDVDKRLILKWILEK